MKLTLEQIKNVTVGALRIWEADGQICFAKMTERQEEAFRALSEGLYNGARTTTGVRLEFYTNSKSVTVATYRNGEYRERNLVPTEGKVSIVLASHAREYLSFVEVEDGATVCPCTYDTKMLFIGDSITQGWHSTDDALSYAYLVSRHFNAESVIQGIGGSYFHPTTADRVNFDPDTVIVAYGTNDVGRYESIADFSEVCSSYLSKIKEAYGDSKIVVLTPLWRTDYDTPRAYGHMQLLFDAIRDVALSLGLFVIDGLSLMPHDASFLTDNVHPGDNGFAVYAKNLIAKLENPL